MTETVGGTGTGALAVRATVVMLIEAVGETGAIVVTLTETGEAGETGAYI